MWVDRDCYLVVGTQTENESGSVVRSSRYVSLQVNPDDIDPAIFEVRGKSKPAQKAASCPGFKVMKPSYVPAGYKLVGTASLSVNGFTCVHLQFSNGVNTISIFEHPESLRGRQAPPEPERVESKTTNVLTWTRDGVQFTIMGDFPRPELHKIANSTK
jgi:negative regulator of sigma E activity